MEDQRNLKCDECGRSHNFILHRIPHFHNIRRFCTGCVLKSFPGSYCAICFRVFDTLPPPAERAMCLTCHSISHLSCSLSFGADLSFLHQCPHCKNPSPISFDLNFHAKQENRIDLESAAQLSSAAWISSARMKRAAVAAREKAAKKAREVVVARRNLKEALERLSNASKVSPTAVADSTMRGSEDGDSVAAVVGESSRNGNAALNKHSHL